MNLTQLAAVGGLAVLMATPVFATPYCIAVNGGFGNGGTTFVGRNFTLPAVNSCTGWTGYTKTASTVILTTSGTACLSTDGTVLTFSLASQDPSFLGAGKLAADYIQLCPKGAVGNCHGSDQGEFGGTAAVETCTAALQQLPARHD